MSSEYDRPDREPDADPCAHTDYDTDADYAERESVEGEVPQTGAGAEGLERRVWEILYGIEDPEMPISVVDLGLIYGVDADESDGAVEVEMTLTYTGCPARDMLINEVTQAVAAADGVADVGVTLVWSPGWTVDMVTERGRESLQEFGLSV
jgi:metal-sulfur cluster biosynthetic enzyme